MQPDQRPEMLKIENLHAWYGESHILHGLDLTLREGEVITLLGRNGSGRTTTLKSILGLVSKRTGSIKIHGIGIINMPTHRIAHVGKLGYCPEERGIFASLNVDENLELPPVVADGGMSADEIYKMFPNLEERRKSQGSKLSGASNRCWQLPASFVPAPISCYWTRSPKGLRRLSSNPWMMSSANCVTGDSPSFWLSRTSALPLRWPTDTM